MKINNKEVDVSDLIKEDLHKNFHKLYGKNIYLSDSDLEILKRYDFNINNYSDIKVLMFDIEEYLEDNNIETDDLEDLLNNLSEFDYYHNINK